MPTHAKAVGDWIATLPPRSFFATADVPGPARAVETALSRLATTDGPIQRVRQGLYWKQPPATPFGRSRPDPTDAAFAAAGAGSGLSGSSAANALGLSTQVPRQPVVAVVGRPPKGLSNVRFVDRSNPHRITLNHLEITFLEVLVDFDKVSEIDWPTAATRLRQIASTSDVDLGRLGAVAKQERRPGITARIASLVSA
jgi:hypothetical protein